MDENRNIPEEANNIGDSVFDLSETAKVLDDVKDHNSTKADAKVLVNFVKFCVKFGQGKDYFGRFGLFCSFGIVQKKHSKPTLSPLEASRLWKHSD